jgi:hypothetical protein
MGSVPITAKKSDVPQAEATRNGSLLPVMVTAATENPAKWEKLSFFWYSLNSGSDAGISIIPRGAKVFQILAIRAEFG